MANEEIKLVAQNRRARHDYEILDTYECGLVLKGAEVKSLREGKAQLRDAYARIEDGEAWLFSLHIPQWANATGWGKVDPDRKRKLLLHLKEISVLHEKTTQQSLTLVPLSVYFKNGRAKIELALARGRKRYDKRAAIAKRDASRDTEREVSHAMRHGH
jgi:SsrA-binding protein